MSSARARPRLSSLKTLFLLLILDQSDEGIEVLVLVHFIHRVGAERLAYGSANANQTRPLSRNSYIMSYMSQQQRTRTRSAAACVLRDVVGVVWCGWGGECVTSPVDVLSSPHQQYHGARLTSLKINHDG